jgi:hypothetical protein
MIPKIAVTAAAALALAGCASAGHPDSTPASSGQAAPAATAPAPSATASPGGTFSGSCDYTLGDDPAGGTAKAVGEVDEKNTGNVGLKLRVTISWPQEGFAPLTETKHIRLPFGGSKAVRFHIPLTFDQLDNLQNWQEGHGLRDGCHYHSVETGTYGDTH